MGLASTAQKAARSGARSPHKPGLGTVTGIECWGDAPSLANLSQPTQSISELGRLWRLCS